MANNNSKDIANSLNKYTDYAHKGTNLLLDGTENVASGLIEETDESASIYCGEESASTQSSLCAKNY